MSTKYHQCPAENTNATTVDLLTASGEEWKLYRIGWFISFCATCITVLITVVHIFLHLVNYRRPAEQRQIVRIIAMPLVYAVVSWFSYRFFKAYTYFSFAQAIYEALTIAAFTMLMILFIGESREKQLAALAHKDKRKLMFPLCFWRYRPSKPYFLYALKWSVLQYAFLRPIISIVGIVCEAFGVLCPTQYSPFFAEIYLDTLDFISITVALYGLILFYTVAKPELAGKRPLSRFLSIKLIVMAVFYQGFMINMLVTWFDVIKPTPVLSASNISDGITAFATCVEMVGFSIWMAVAFRYTDYSRLPEAKGWTNPFKAFLNVQNYWDFVREFLLTFTWYRDYRHNVPGTHGDAQSGRVSAFDLSGAINGPRASSHRPTDPEKGYTPVDPTAAGWIPAPEGEGAGSFDEKSGEAMATVPLTPHGQAPAGAARFGRGWEDGVQRAGTIQSHAPRPVAGANSWQERWDAQVGANRADQQQQQGYQQPQGYQQQGYGYGGR